ncbi:MAG: hypothetical protein M0Z96_04655 [Actinomycetota bacterium]|nr:hypothetical protein [Actinomycetota bacterium]
MSHLWVRKTALLLVLSVATVSCGPAATSAVATTLVPVPSSTSSTSTTTTTAAPDRGLLPQTSVKPSKSGAHLTSEVSLLWNAIVTGDPQIADPFFFPLSAYMQVKAISDPVHDYDTRLIYAYDSDLLAYHQELMKMGGVPKLSGFSIPEIQAQWILPGVEYNKGSYWRVYGSKLYFSVDGRTHYFPIFSLISWRGQWYVVHVGPPTS